MCVTRTLFPLVTALDRGLFCCTNFSLYNGDEYSIVHVLPYLMTNLSEKNKQPFARARRINFECETSHNIKDDWNVLDSLLYWICNVYPTNAWRLRHSIDCRFVFNNFNIKFNHPNTSICTILLAIVIEAWTENGWMSALESMLLIVSYLLVSFHVIYDFQIQMLTIAWVNKMKILFRAQMPLFEIHVRLK